LNSQCKSALASINKVLLSQSMNHILYAYIGMIKSMCKKNSAFLSLEKLLMGGTPKTVLYVLTDTLR